MITRTWPSRPVLACIVCSAVGGGFDPQLGATRRWHEATPHVRSYLAETTDLASAFLPAVGLYVRPSSVESPMRATRSTPGAGEDADAAGPGTVAATTPTTGKATSLR